MKALFTTALSLIGALTIAQNHSSQNIRMIVEQEHDHIANYDSYTVRCKLYNHQNEILYEADLFNGKELDETFFYYNEDMDIYEERRIFNVRHESGMVELEYDDKGHLVEQVEYDDEGYPIIRLIMLYDEKGNMKSKQRELHHEGQHDLYVESDFSYTYDETGRVKRMDGFENGKNYENSSYQFWYENNDLKHIKEKLVEEFDEDNKSEEVVVERWTEDYSADNHLIEYKHTVYEGGKEHVRADVKYTYTDHGDIATEVISKEGKVVKEIRFEYTYDNHGNWITKHEFKGLGDKMEEVATIQRWIEYYGADEYPHPPMELDEQMTVTTDPATKKHTHTSAETHVRINDNAGKVIWQVRRNGPDLFQVDYNQYAGGMLVQTKHLNNYKKENYYTNYSYASNGKCNLEESFSFDEKLDDKATYAYDDKGMLTKREEKMLNFMTKKMEVAISEEFTYDKNGNVHTSKLTEFGSVYEIEYLYDAEGNNIAKITKPEDKAEKGTTERFHYENGLMTGKDVLEGENGTPIENDVFEYDEDKELIHSKFYEKGELRRVVNYEYFK